MKDEIWQASCRGGDQGFPIIEIVSDMLTFGPTAVIEYLYHVRSICWDAVFRAEALNFLLSTVCNRYFDYSS